MTQDTRAQFNRRLASQFESEQAEQWQLPDVGEEPEQQASLAMNISSGVEEPELQDEEEAPAPPTLAEIEAIREDAHQEGYEEGLAKGTQQGLEEGRLKGLEEGHSQGFQQGLEQGLEEGRARIDAQLALFDTLLNQLVAPLQAVDNQVEQELVELSLHLARSVIGCEVKSQPDALLMALRQGIEALPSRNQKVTVQLCAEDLQRIRECYGEAELERRDWQLELEPSLALGSIKLSTQRSEVNLPLAERIDTVFNQFHNQPRPVVDEPDYPHFQSVSPKSGSDADASEAELVTPEGEALMGQTDGKPELPPTGDPAPQQNVEPEKAQVISHQELADDGTA